MRGLHLMQTRFDLLQGMICAVYCANQRRDAFYALEQRAERTVRRNAWITRGKLGKFSQLVVEINDDTGRMTGSFQLFPADALVPQHRFKEIIRIAFQRLGIRGWHFESEGRRKPFNLWHGRFQQSVKVDEYTICAPSSPQRIVDISSPQGCRAIKRNPVAHHDGMRHGQWIADRNDIARLDIDILKHIEPEWHQDAQPGIFEAHSLTCIELAPDKRSSLKPFREEVRAGHQGRIDGG